MNTIPALPGVRTLRAGGRTVTKPTAVERKSSWLQTAGVILSIFGSAFLLGRTNGSEMASVRSDLAAGQKELAESNKNLSNLSSAIIGLTNVTQESTKEELRQRQWSIRILQALTDSLSAGERNRRLREIAAEMRVQGKNEANQEPMISGGVFNSLPKGR